MKFDLTDSASKAFGNNLIFKGSKFCIYSGDIDKSGFIDASDFAIIDNAAYEFSSGYEISDINGDYIVDGTDMSTIENNGAIFVTIIIP